MPLSNQTLLLGSLPLCFALVLTGQPAFAQQSPASGSSQPAAAPAQETPEKKIEKLETALKKAQERLNTSRPRVQSAEDLHKAMPTAEELTKLSFSPEAVTRLRDFARRLRQQDAAGSAFDTLLKEITAFSEGEKSLDKEVASLKTAREAVAALTFKPEEKELKEKADKLVKEATEAEAGLTALFNSAKQLTAKTNEVSALKSDVLRCYALAAALLKPLEESFEKSRFGGINDKTAAADARSILVDDLLKLLAEEQKWDSLQSSNKELDAALKAIFPKDHAEQSKPYTTSSEKLETARARIVGAIGTAFRIVNTDVESRLEPMQELTRQVRQEAARQESDTIPTTSTALSAAAQLLADIQLINSNYPRLTPYWNTDALKKSAATSEQFLNALMTTQELLGGGVAILQETLAGDLNRFVHDQIRLFYFADVPRLMQALNARSAIVNKESLQFAEEAKKARRALTESDGDLAAALAEANLLRSRRIAIEEEIRLVNARAENAALRADRAKAQTTLLDAQISRLTADKDTADDATKTKIDAELKLLQERKTAQTSRQTEADAAKTAADTEREKLLSEQGELPTRAAAAQQKLVDAQIEVQRLRRVGARLAEEEVEAFAAARDNAPFWYAPATIASRDPAKRVMLYAFADSKTLFIRGLPKDVEAVKELVASFDRPAPQARITLYTLQMNGKPHQINNALASIDDTLSDLRGTILLIQEIFRSCVNQEVNRVAYIAQETVRDIPEMKRLIQGRMARYYFYTREVRKTLGLEIELPPALEFLTVMREELRLALLYYLEARQANKLILQRPRQKSPGAERDDFLARADYHFRKFLAYWERLSAYQAMGLEVTGKLDNNKQQMELIQQRLYRLVDNKKLSSLNAVREKLRELYLREASAREFETAFGSGGGGLEGGNAIQSLEPPIREVLSEMDKLQADLTTRLPQSDLATLEELESTHYLTQWTLPDPAHSTTLGEMLFIVSLGTREARERIMNDFAIELQRTIVSLDRENTTGRKKQSETALRSFANALLDALRAHLGQAPTRSFASVGEPPLILFHQVVLNGITGRLESETNRQEMSANQKEILMAVQARVREAVAAEVRHLLRQIEQTPARQRNSTDSYTVKLRNQYLPLVGWLRSTLYNFDPNSPQLSWFLSRGNWYLRGLGVLDMNTMPTNEGDIRRLDHAVWNLSYLQGQRNTLSRATARVAAADDMIKRMILTIEHDLEQLIVEKALEKVRTQATAKGAQLGSLQRESMLATNRLVARIDPNANADLKLQGDQDLLQSAMQLGRISSQFLNDQKAKKLSDVMPLIAGGASALANVEPVTATGIGLLTSLFGTLAAEPREAEGEIYSINSGNQFKVTPIFDPSGQSLRFRFDFTGTTRVAEPNGTVNRQIPRVERHSTNTEVQITNLEFREISRFETNAQVGKPPERIGGVPLLKEIPIIRDIPILGYYVRRKGSDALRQHSLIFAQSSLYPTVADIVDLLVDAPLRSDLDHTVPDYLEPRVDIQLNSLRVVSGTRVTGRLQLNSIYDEEVDVTLRSDNPAIQFGPVVTFGPVRQSTQIIIPAGSRVVELSSGYVNVNEPTTATLIAEYNGRIQTVRLLLLPKPN